MKGLKNIVIYVDSYQRINFFLCWPEIKSGCSVEFFCLNRGHKQYLTLLGFDAVCVLDFQRSKNRSYNMSVYNEKIFAESLFGWSQQDLSNAIWAARNFIEQQPINTLYLCWNSEYFFGRVLNKIKDEGSRLDTIFFEATNFGKAFYASRLGTNELMNFEDIISRNEIECVLGARRFFKAPFLLKFMCAIMSICDKYHYKTSKLPKFFAQSFTKILTTYRIPEKILILQLKMDSNICCLPNNYADYSEFVLNHVADGFSLRVHPKDNDFFFHFTIALKSFVRFRAFPRYTKAKPRTAFYVTLNSNLGFELMLDGYSVEVLGSSSYGHLSDSERAELYWVLNNRGIEY